MIRLTELARNAVSDLVVDGDCVIDATAGNGHDTVFLAQQVGSSGKVFAFDNQALAVSLTSDSLKHHGLSDRVEIFCCGHEQLIDKVPAYYHNKIRTIMFNLGYLPGADKSHTTLPESSIHALEQAYELIMPGGALSVISYTGHKGGQLETEAVISWAKAQSSKETRLERPGSDNHPPQWLWMIK